MESIKKTQQRIGKIRQSTRGLLVFTLFTAIYSGMAASADAQTFGEWFQQKSTQKKYLLQQIAALQVFSGYLKQGYQIAHNGLGSISGSLTTENNLHTTYYSRLSVASPAIRNNDQVRAILAWQIDILTILKGIDQINGLTGPEKNYLASVRSAVLKDCDQQINALQVVITDGKSQMSDADRLVLIGKIHAGMLDNYHFASGFTAQAKTYASQRLQAQSDAQTAKEVYGIN